MPWLGLAAALVAFRELLDYQPRRAVFHPVESWFFETNEGTPQLAYAAFVLLLWWGRHEIRDRLAGGGHALGAGLLLAASAALFAWARVVDQVDLLFDVFLLGALGSALLLGGWRLVGVLALPLLVLWCARPLPPALTHHLHHALQHLTADFASELLRFRDVPTWNSGDLILSGGEAFEIVETCSGLRIIQTLAMSGLVYVALLGRGLRGGLMVLLVAPPVGFLVNGLRALLLIVTGNAPETAVHWLQGILMFTIGFSLLTLVDRVASRVLPEPRVNPGAAPAAPLGSWRPAAVSAFATGLALLSFVDLRAELPAANLWQVHQIDREIGDWRARRFDWKQLPYGSVRFARRISYVYQRPGQRIRVVLGVDDRQQRNRSGVSPRTRLPGAGWEVTERETATLPSLPVPAERLMVQRSGDRRLVYHWRIGFHSLADEVLRWVLALDRRPGGVPESILVAQVSTRVHAGDEIRARLLLESFLADFVPAMLSTAPESFRGDPNGPEI